MRPTITELPKSNRSAPPPVPSALGAAGYVEREFLVEGTAAVYGPNDPAWKGRVTLSRAEIVPLGRVVRTDVPYATRIIIRSPAHRAGFSRTVVVEPIHNMGEMTPSWNVTYRHHLQRGHAWIGVTVSTGPHISVGGHSTGGIGLLRQLDPVRYGALDLVAGEPDDWPLLRNRDDSGKGLLDVLADSPFTGKSTDGTAFGVMIEEIYRSYAHSPDVVAQLAALLKVEGLDGWPVERLIGTGASGTTAWWNAFIDGGHHDRAPNFDGYVLYVATPPRSRPGDAAVVSVISEAEAMLAVIEADTPPPDTDDPTFRQYELAGTGHQLSGADDAGVTDALSTHASTLDQARPNGLIPYDRANHPILHGIWRALEERIAHGVPMPPSVHIDRDADGEGGLARDQYGNARGGLRPPWVEAPNARYFARSPWNPLRACMAPFTADRMRKLYGDVETYRAAFKGAVESLVAEGWVGADEAEDFEPGGF
jgi:hypothetical protein